MTERRTETKASQVRPNVERGFPVIGERTACPECKGEGRFRGVRHAQVCGTIEDDETRHHFCYANCERYDHECRVCRGKATLDGIQLAVYKARGGAPPVQRRGFA